MANAQKRNNHLRESVASFNLEHQDKKKLGKLITHFAEANNTEHKAWNEQTKLEKCYTVFEKIDIFPYEEPKKKRFSVKSGVTSLAAVIVYICFIIPEFVLFFNGFHFINREQPPSHRSFASLPQKLPPVTVAPGFRSELGKSPYFWNESYYKIVFSQKVIYDSDTNTKNKPRKSIQIPGVRCQIKIHENQDYLNAWCPDKEVMKANNLDAFTVMGDYIRNEYRYVTADVVTCYNYNNGNYTNNNTNVDHQNKLKCAPKNEINDLFYKHYSTMAFYMRQVDDITSNSYEWKSPSVISIQPNSWIGVENYFRPHKFITYNSLNIKTKESTYIKYEMNEKRVNARKDGEEIMRFYFRMYEQSTIETSTVYTFTNLLTKFGGLYVLIFGIGRVVGVTFNFGKHKALSFMKREHRHRQQNRSWEDNPLNQFTSS